MSEGQHLRPHSREEKGQNLTRRWPPRGPQSQGGAARRALGLTPTWKDWQDFIWLSERASVLWIRFCSTRKWMSSMLKGGLGAG